MSTATVVPPLPQTELVGELEKVVFAPGHLVFMRAGRAVEPKEGAQSVAALSGGIGRYLSYALYALLRSARGTSVLLLLHGASSSASEGLEAGAAASIISTTPYLLAVLVTGTEVNARATAAVIDGQKVPWERLVCRGEFGATADARGFFRQVAVPTLALIEAT